MARRKSAAPPAVSRKSLLEWIDHDDGDTTGFTQPECSEKDQSLHARVVGANHGRGAAQFEPIQPPPGLYLAPLG